MKVGLDAFTVHPLKLSPQQILAFAKAHELDGVQFGTMNCISAHLDPSELLDFRNQAQSMGLYSHVSVPSPNVVTSDCSADELFHTLSTHISLAAACGWTELHSVLGGPETRYHHPVPWTEHLEQTTAFLRRLAPVLRDHACRINLENHGDITTFELVRMIEAAGADVLGVCLDTANVLCFAEDPVAAAARVAPYTHLTHAKDAIVYFCDKGLQRQGRPPGQGVVAWPQVLRILSSHNPGLPLSIEDHKWLFEAAVFTDAWHQQNPDLSRLELAHTMKLAWSIQEQIIRGQIPRPADYEDIPFETQLVERLTAGRDYLREKVRLT